jgi:hypothetical protein
LRVRKTRIAQHQEFVMVRKITAAAIAALFVPVAQAADAVGWEKLWTFTHGAATSVAGQTSEIVAFDSLNNGLWVDGLGMIGLAATRRMR